MNTDTTRAHIDAETLAAWADRALPAEEAAAVELHLSNCDRCQEVLAAFVRSAPMTGAVVIPFWARRPVQWSAAGLAAVAALVAMIWIGRPPPVSAPESTVASRNVAQEAPPVSASAPAELRRDKSASASVNQLREKVTADKPASAPAELKKEKPASAAELRQGKQSSISAREERGRDNPARALDDKAAANQLAAKKTEGRAAALPPASMTAPPPPPPAAAAVAAPPPPVTVAGAAAPVVTPVATPLGAARPAAMYESVVVDAISAIPLTFEIAAPDPNSPARRSELGAGGRGGGGGGRALSQSLGPTRWRVVAGTRVERTTDAGTTWTALPIEPVLKTPLLAGSATSPLNCWLVGREGVVLITHDGLTFRRVSVPEAVHLTGVTATDGLRALVTAFDGRTFSTIDGGLTWK